MTDAEDLTAWLRQNQLPLAGIAPVAGIACVTAWDDLRPLRTLWSGAKVVGLGETTHGTREFFQIRHRLLQFLVTELGFKALAIEASHSATQRVNDYVLTGGGDKDAILTGLGSVMWDVVEFGDVLDWLKAYNRSVPREQRVHVWGVDIFHTRRGRERILAWMRQTAPQHTAAIESLFQTVAEAESRGLLLAPERLTESTLTGLHEIAESLTAEQDALIERSSKQEYESALRHLEVIVQWVRAYRPNEISSTAPRFTGLNIYVRSRFMADNLIHAIEQDTMNRKAVLWAHNLHISVGFEDATHGTVPNMGQRLREKLGDGYYALGFECNQGEYLCREWAEPGKSLGNLTIGRIDPAPLGWLPEAFAHAGQQFILDLRTAQAQGATAAWLDSPQTLYCTGWAHTDPTLTTRVVPRKHYDGFLFLDTTTATTPTPNAVETVARGAGH